MTYLLSHAFAGLWAFIWHWGVGIGFIVCLVALAYFTTAVPLIGPYLTAARKDLLWAAFGIGVFMAGMALGTHDANRRHEKQKIVVQQTVEKAVAKTKTVKYRQKKDRWDRSEY